jgi:hypothetical protein
MAAALQKAWADIEQEHASIKAEYEASEKTPLDAERAIARFEGRHRQLQATLCELLNTAADVDRVNADMRRMEVNAIRASGGGGPESRLIIIQRRFIDETGGGVE